VLVDGDEVVYDSKRILQYLDWRYAKSDSADAKKDE
jgi:glutathione S-transferase